MNTHARLVVVAVLFAAFSLITNLHAQTNAPRITSAVWTNGAFSLAWTNSGTNAVTIERRTSLDSGLWTAIGSNNVASAHSDTNTPVGSAFYRLRMVTGNNAPPTNMALIPAGSFEMGDKVGSIEGGDGSTNELPVHTVNVSAFYMDKYEVTKALWDEVANWAATNGYDISAASAMGGARYPAYSVTWYEAVKWCNARSEKDGLTTCYTVDGATYKTSDSNNVVCNFSANGYRLPTEAEWEKAARGGVSGQRFPWGDTITHSQANYYSSDRYSYDVSPTRGYYANRNPFDSPVGSFAPNGYGLYDTAGNMQEWCWDWFSSRYYASSPASDPRGPSSANTRVVRGGSYYRYSLEASLIRTANRDAYHPAYFDTQNDLGFRCARSSVP
jgi:sulfatase modifying factor 1